jgi:phosphatidylglycerophosphate synthase
VSGILQVLFGISLLLFIGMFHFFLASKRPGVYPPKHILRKRAASLAMGAVVFFLLGLIVYVLK